MAVANAAIRAARHRKLTRRSMEHLLKRMVVDERRPKVVRGCMVVNGGPPPV
jgi:hypothetical protein